MSVWDMSPDVCREGCGRYRIGGSGLTFSRSLTLFLARSISLFVSLSLFPSLARSSSLSRSLSLSLEGSGEMGVIKITMALFETRVSVASGWADCLPPVALAVCAKSSIVCDCDSLQLHR